MHHIEKSADRVLMLKEFRRISSDTIIVSLWVDGNYQAWRRQRLARPRMTDGRSGENQNRFVVPRAVIEDEFRQAGFQILAYQDFLPGYALWRIYVLRKTR